MSGAISMLFIILFRFLHTLQKSFQIKNPHPGKKPNKGRQAFPDNYKNIFTLKKNWKQENITRFHTDPDSKKRLKKQDNASKKGRKSAQPLETGILFSLALVSSFTSQAYSTPKPKVDSPIKDPYKKETTKENERGLETEVIHLPTVQISAPQDQVLAIGSLLPTPRTDLTASSLLIDKEQLTYQGTRFLTDLLKRTAGFSVSRSGPAGSLSQIRIRGSEANHALVFIDGQPVASALDGSFDLSQITTESIEQIEILRGEQSALWGSGALGGVINIITRTEPPENPQKFYFMAGYGRYKSLQNHLSGAGKLTKTTYLTASHTHTETAGYDASGQSGEKDGSEQKSWQASFSFQPKSGSLKLLSHAYWLKAKADYDSDTDYNGRLNNTKDQHLSETRLFNLSLQKPQSKNLEHVFSAAYAKEDSKIVLRSYETNSQKMQLSYSGKYEHSLTSNSLPQQESLASQQNFLSTHDLPPLRLSWRAEWQKEDFQSKSNQKYQINNQLETYGFALEALGRFGQSKNLIITASGRFDKSNRFREALTWRFGSALLLMRNRLKLRTSLGTGFKAPNAFELFGGIPKFFTGNPDIKPEESISMETGLTYWSDHWTFSASYFKSRLEDEIYTDFSSRLLTVQNRKENSSREGVEAELFLFPRQAFSLSLSFTHLQAKENNLPEIRRPNYSASLTGLWTLSSLPIKLSAQLNYTGKAEDMVFKTPVSERVTLDAYLLFSAQAYWQITKQVEAFLKGENLFNANYQDVFGYPQSKISLFAGIRVHL